VIKGSPRASSRTRSHPPRSTFFGLLGELFLTAGILVLLFLGWQLWWNDWVLAGQQSTVAAKLSQEWLHPNPTVQPVDDVSADPIVMAPPSSGEKFAIMYVPRFGVNTQRPIAEGIGVNTLNNSSIGVGHYPETQMPGEVGNFAIAAHRSAYGGGMHLINALELGDPIYIQTQDGWYTYLFRDLQYAQPTQVSVLDQVPNIPEQAATDRLITLTTCNPFYSTAERIIAFGVFESFKPSAAGPPVAIADHVTTWGV
jgi:sortase A